VITFPSTSFEMITEACTISGLNSKYSCVSSGGTLTITITSFLDSAAAAGKTFTFTISNLSIRNPPSVRPSNPISIYTTTEGYIMDSSDSVTVTATSV
jgi:hypothetical protein